MERKIVHLATNQEYGLTKVKENKYAVTIDGEYVYYTSDEIMTYLMQDVWKLI